MRVRRITRQGADPTDARFILQRLVPAGGSPTWTDYRLLAEPWEELQGFELVDQDPAQWRVIDKPNAKGERSCEQS